MAFELGAASVGLAAVGIGYLAFHERYLTDRRGTDAVQMPHYIKSLEIFDNEKVERVLPHGRHLMAAAAARIFVASYVGVEGAITKDSLQEMFAASSDELLHVSGHKLQVALSYLKDNELIDRRPQESNRKVQGYHALPALTWAFEYDELPPVLAEAQANFLNELL